MPTPEETFQTLCDHFRSAARLESIAEVLEWDERTGMPTDASEYRAEQVTQLRGMVHRMRTEPRVGDWIGALQTWDAASDRHTPIGCTVEHLCRDYDRATKLPAELVEAIAGASVRGQGRWDAARRSDDYAIFQPSLDEMLRLKTEAAQAIAVDGQTAYEALLDEFEPAAKVSELTRVFGSLRSELAELMGDLLERSRRLDRSPIERSFAIEGQTRLSHRLAEAIGFDFNRGRLDTTSHPFCTTLGPSDCRILTRYDRDHLATSLFGTLHEAGHGLYEQGLPQQWYGLPPGQYASLGVHESQSRLWENLVGRSVAFFEFALPIFRECLPELGAVSAESLQACFRNIEPSLIRVEADEATYNLHILIRFELEQALLEGNLTTSDLPSAWADAYADAIGIRPPSAADGVLQDVHWSAGLIGYFPTYSLGNLMAAQFMESARKAMPGMDDDFRRGDFQPLLQWLRDHVHRWGRRYTANELVERATGQPLSIDPLIQSLKSRYLD